MRSAEEILRAIRELKPEPVKLMEVCGTHTMAIAKSGLRERGAKACCPRAWSFSAGRAARSASPRRRSSTRSWTSAWSRA